jgi:hypothetical protein
MDKNTNEILGPYDALEKYVIDNKISNIDLYNDAMMYHKFSEYFNHMLPFRVDGINIKVYSLLRNIRNIKLNLSDINISYMAQFGRLIEMMYNDANYKIMHMNEYEILHRKIDVSRFCKCVILFLDTTIKIIDNDCNRQYFCFGTGKKCDGIHDKCIKKCGLTTDEITHMQNIKNIANMAHNYPVQNTDYDNLFMYVSEQTKDLDISYENGNPYFIKNFGNINNLYSRTCDILSKIMYSVFGKTLDINQNISILCQNSIGITCKDITSYTREMIGNCVPIL